MNDGVCLTGLAMVSFSIMSDTPHHDSTPKITPAVGDLLPGVKRIETIARGAILDQGHVLLCRSVKHRYSYLPGGHVEPGETASYALSREMIEEAGVTITPGELALVAESRFIQKGKPRHEITLVFHVEHTLSASRPVPSLEKHIEFWWADLASLVDHDIRPNSAKSWLATLDAASTAGSALWIEEYM